VSINNKKSLLIKRIPLMLGLILLVGCVTKPLDVTLPETTATINASRIIIEDLSTPKNEWESGISLGFRAVPDNVINPPFTEYLVTTFKTRLKAVGNPSTSELSLKVLDAQLVYEMNAADAIPFVAMLAAGSERKHVCRANISMMSDSKSDRQVYEVAVARNGFWRGLSSVEQASLVQECVEGIMKDVALTANNLLSPN
jgi:hypothetical protein